MVHVVEYSFNEEYFLRYLLLGQLHISIACLIWLLLPHKGQQFLHDIHER